MIDNLLLEHTLMHELVELVEIERYRDRDREIER